MSAGIYNLEIEQGATFERLITLNTSTSGSPLNLTEYTGKAQIRRGYGSSEVTVEFTVTFLEPRSNGQLRISLTSTQTSALSPLYSYVYDLEITKSGVVTRVLQGTIIVSPEVTKS